MYKQLNQIRIDKKSPLFVRKSKLFSWLLTLISIALLIAFIVVLVLAIYNSVNLRNTIITTSNPRDNAISLVNESLKCYNLLYCSISLFISFFITFFVFKIFACIFNIIRYISDYKRNVVPVKSILITRLIFQSIMIILLIIGIIFSLLGIIKIFVFGNELINSFVDLSKTTLNKLLITNDDAEIQNILNEFQINMNQKLKNIDFPFDKNTSLFILIGLFSKILWLLFLIIYGISIKIILSKNANFFGDDSLKTITKENHNDNKDDSKKEEKEELKQNKDVVNDEVK